MILQIDSTQQDLGQFTNEDVGQQMKRLTPYVNYFRDSVQDPTNRELWVTHMSRLHDLYSSLTKYNIAREKLIEEGDKTQKQLETLKHDLKHELLDSTRADQYFNDEVRYFNQWRGQAIKRVSKAEYARDHMDEFMPILDSIYNHYARP